VGWKEEAERVDGNKEELISEGRAWTRRKELGGGGWRERHRCAKKGHVVKGELTTS